MPYLSLFASTGVAIPFPPTGAFDLLGASAGTGTARGIRVVEGAGFAEWGGSRALIRSRRTQRLARAGTVLIDGAIISWVIRVAFRIC